MIADNPLSDYADGPEKSLERICRLELKTPPGTKFTYSDVGYIVLGELVKRIGGMPLDEFATKNIFEPIGMKHTGYRPAVSVHERCAPTEERDGRWIRGEVHDPRAWALGGVAGDAGVFSTVDDLLLYARMILDGGAVSYVSSAPFDRTTPSTWR